MHYLTELAEKLAAAYEDRDNLSQWVSSDSHEANQLAQIETLRAILEQEVAKGNLRYNRLKRPDDYPRSENVLTGFKF